MDMFDIGATIRTKKDLNEDQMHNMPGKWEGQKYMEKDAESIFTKDWKKINRFLHSEFTS